MRTLCFLLLASIALPGLAQYQGPAVEACRAYARQEQNREGATAKDVVFDRDRHLVIERYARKLGSQFVASILTGNGAVVLEGAPSAELAFICLLADEKRPVFFNWLPRQDAPALAHCVRSDELRAKPRPCLDLLQQLAEAELNQQYAQRFQEARERDAAAKGDRFEAAYRKANEEWRRYRDAECVRRRDHAPKGVGADDVQLACIVELTRRRALDMR
ncbi:MAG: hypothetical protein A3D95_03000 [Betaproteobacteria bacterium RIFCSPHIGHO2_12_FULL_69_13]|nr:MAG: hypothetical protein A3D95_03000 [Betaproteobacteria bacterium RIFCSPHIGHO2_12_FULL_69_13]OGA66866.1 MAG: hypothetical protein A3G83_13245 [Betaproteobacteria bacterium RIFCSPLOWO2_12_FULL_68_20]